MNVLRAALYLAPLLSLLSGGESGAQSSDLPFTPDERRAFHAELRALFLDEPELLLGTAPQPDLYADEKAADLARIADHGQELFGVWPAPRRIALFTSPECATCRTAEAELTALANDLGWQVITHPFDGPLARTLDLPDAPFYVLPDLLIRGAMPAPVLRRYLTARDGD
mgnify:FL=1